VDCMVRGGSSPLGRIEKALLTAISDFCGRRLRPSETAREPVWQPTLPRHAPERFQLCDIFGAGRRPTRQICRLGAPARVHYAPWINPPATLLMWSRLRSPELAEDFERLMAGDRDIVRGSLDPVSDWRLTRSADVPGTACRGPLLLRRAGRVPDVNHPSGGHK
jgi:hypothetical protein